MRVIWKSDFSLPNQHKSAFHNSYLLYYTLKNYVNPNFDFRDGLARTIVYCLKKRKKMTVERKKENESRKKGKEIHLPKNGSFS